MMEERIMTESIRVLIPEEEVNKKIREMAEQISEDMGNETITLICILKGSVFFSCELAKHIKDRKSTRLNSSHTS